MHEDARGVTKLRKEIYILCPLDHLIRVYEDREPFRLQKDMEIEETKFPRDIGSSEQENCLYVSDNDERCVWKITRETDDQHKIIKWLTTDYKPWTLSVSREGELLMINRSSHSLMIYGPDAELIRSIPITRDIKYPYHAVETTIGNFIIIDKHFDRDEEVDEEEDGEMDQDKDEDGGDVEVVMEERKQTKWLESREGQGESNRRMEEITSIVTDLTRDGQVVTRRFIPSDETQKLFDCRYLLVDSDDRVFVTDIEGGKVILLDSDLKWNRILCPTREEKEEQDITLPVSLLYDEEMKQLIVGGFFEGHVNVYTLSRN